MGELTMKFIFVLYMCVSSLCMPETHIYLFLCSENVSFKCVTLKWSVLGISPMSQKIMGAVSSIMRQQQMHRGSRNSQRTDDC